MAKFYPRKQTFFIFIICVLAVGGLIAYTRPKTFISNKVQYNSSSNLNGANVAANINTPIIGKLADEWKKQFIDQKDSSVSLSAKPNINPTSKENLTLTDAMGRNFFTHYLELRKGNLENNDQFIQNAVNQTIDEAVTAAKQARTYSNKDIIVSKTSDSASVKAYANAIGQILLTSSPKANALEISSQAFENGDMKVLSGIDPVIAAYKNMLIRMKSTPVPSTLAQSHLDMMNGFSMMEQMTEGLRNVEKDPMQAIVGLDTHGNAEILVTTALLNIKSYLSRSNLVFGPMEAGSLFASANLSLE